MEFGICDWKFLFSWLLKTHTAVDRTIGYLIDLQLEPILFCLLLTQQTLPECRLLVGGDPAGFQFSKGPKQCKYSCTGVPICLTARNLIAG